MLDIKKCFHFHQGLPGRKGEVGPKGDRGLPVSNYANYDNHLDYSLKIVNLYFLL